MADDLISGMVSAIVGAVSGGGVSIWLNHRSEQRSSYQRSYESFVDSMEDLQGLASVYWRSSGLHPDVERKMILVLESLDRRFEALVRDGLPIDRQGNARDELDRLADELTGGDFQTSARAEDVSRLQRIKQLSRRLLNLLHA